MSSTALHPATDTDANLIALIARVAEQDAQAMRQLYDATSGRLYAVAMRVVSNADHAEDVLQDAYLNIWRIAGDYKQALSPPMAWMGVVVRSRALDFLRRRTAEQSLGGMDINDEALADTLADADSANPMDSTSASQQATALHECMRQIDPQPRQVLALAYFKDLSHSELAEQLKLPLGTVKSWIRRSIEQLRVCLSRFA